MLCSHACHTLTKEERQRKLDLQSVVQQLALLMRTAEDSNPVAPSDHLDKDISARLLKLIFILIISL